MHRITFTLITALVTLWPAETTVSASDPTPAVAPAAPVTTGSLEPEITVVGASAEAEALVRAAVDRFAVAEMTLPDLEVGFHETTDGCQGNRGLFRPRAENTGLIDLCFVSEFLILHELAHAWAHVNLDDTDRGEFVDMVGSPGWRGTDIPWHRRGTEIAADAIAHGMLSEPLDHDHGRSRELHQFEHLTGIEAPRDIADAPATTDEELTERERAAAAAYVAWRQQAASAS